MSIISKKMIFFNSPDECITNYSQTAILYKSSSFILSFGNSFKFLLFKINQILRKVQDQMKIYDTKNLDITKNRLIVCIHGRNSNNSQFETIIRKTEKNDCTNIEIYAPNILEKGNAKIQDMVQPIFTKIDKWLESDQDKEIILIGISNGARISRAVETKLAESKHSKKIKSIKAIFVSGATNGSFLINIAKKLKLSCFITNNIVNEMEVGSKFINARNKEWESSLEKLKTKRSYTFIAAAHDWLVPNFSSTLAKTKNERARYALLFNHGHSSIELQIPYVINDLINNF